MTLKLSPLLAFGLGLMLTGCGTEAGNPKKPKGDGGTGAPPAAPASSLLADRTVATDLISAQADEVIAAAAEEARSANLNLALDPPVVTPKTVNTCTVQDSGEADMQLDVNGEASHTFKSHGQPASFTSQEASSEKALWKLPGAALKCNDAKDALALDWTTAEGLTMDSVFSSTRTTVVTRTGPHGPMTRSGTYQSSGQRHFSWRHDPARDTADTLSLSKTVTGFIDKTVSTTHHNKQVTVASHILVSADAPLEIAVERDRATQSWKSKTIVSGKVTSAQDEDSRVEATYTNLRFTSDAGCVPDSGQISGSMFDADVQAPSRSFTVSFDLGAATITYSDGTQVPYVPAFCLLDNNQ